MTTVFKRPNEVERNINASIYIGNLDPQVTEVLLYELFIQFGPIKSLNMPKDRILKTHQGFGFVEFKEIEDADYVVQILTGIRLFGKIIRIKKTGNGNNTEIEDKLDKKSYFDVGAKLFINNLNPLIDEQFLLQTFNSFGLLIKTPVIVRDLETGESKGHGFLTFEDFSSSDLVIDQMDGKELMGAKVSISYAYKDDPANTGQKKVRHGDEIERLLAEKGKSNKVINQIQTKVSKPKPKNVNRKKFKKNA